VRAVRAQMRAAADAADCEVVLPPDCGIAGVDARIDLDDVAVASAPGGVARLGKLSLGADAQQFRARR